MEVYRMEQTKRKIEIVEYHEGLAAGVAEMWNLSRDGWGGDSHVTNRGKGPNSRSKFE